MRYKSSISSKGKRLRNFISGFFRNTVIDIFERRKTIMTKKMEICKVRNGERFIVDGEEFVKLGDIAGGAFVLLADTLPDYCAFESEDADDDRDHNNFIGSNVKRVVDEWLHRHKTLSDAAMALPIDLTSMDGMTDYGMPNVYGRILTVDEYRKYRRFIPLTDKPFWTATPWCTLSDDYDYSAYYVNSDGSLSTDGAYYAYICARPALALKSSLLVSVSAEDGEKALCDYTDTELLDELLRRRTEKKEVR